MSVIKQIKIGENLYQLQGTGSDGASNTITVTIKPRITYSARYDFENGCYITDSSRLLTIGGGGQIFWSNHSELLPSVIPDSEDKDNPNTIPISKSGVLVDIAAYWNAQSSLMKKWNLWINDKLIDVEEFYKDSNYFFIDTHKGIELHDGDVIEYESTDQYWDYNGGYTLIDMCINNFLANYKTFSIAKKTVTIDGKDVTYEVISNSGDNSNQFQMYYFPYGTVSASQARSIILDYFNKGTDNTTGSITYKFSDDITNSSGSYNHEYTIVSISQTKTYDVGGSYGTTNMNSSGGYAYVNYATANDLARHRKDRVLKFDQHLNRSGASYKWFGDEYNPEEHGTCTQTVVHFASCFKNVSYDQKTKTVTLSGFDWFRQSAMKKLYNEIHSNVTWSQDKTSGIATVSIGLYGALVEITNHPNISNDWDASGDQQFNSKVERFIATLPEN